MLRRDCTELFLASQIIFGSYQIWHQLITARPGHTLALCFSIPPKFGQIWQQFAKTNAFSQRRSAEVRLFASFHDDRRVCLPPGYWMRQTLEGSFSAVSKRNFASKYAFESSRRDLHNALLCTALKSHLKNARILPKFAKISRIFANFAKCCKHFGKILTKI